MKGLLATSVNGAPAVGLLMVRVLFGLGMTIHGIPKIQRPFDWMPGGAMPSWLIALAALSEFAGGIALMLGLLTRPAAFGIACTMAVGIMTAHRNDPFVSATGGRSFELAALYLGVALLLLLAGAGQFSVDAQLAGGSKRKR